LLHQNNHFKHLHLQTSATNLKLHLLRNYRRFHWIYVHLVPTEVQKIILTLVCPQFQWTNAKSNHPSNLTCTQLMTSNHSTRLSLNLSKVRSLRNWTMYLMTLPRRKISRTPMQISSKDFNWAKV
jgi:hypothetical protein